MATTVKQLPNFDKFWNYAQPAETELKFRELLPQAKASGDTGYYIELLTQIARTHSLRQQFDQAHAILDDAEKMLTDDLARARIRCLLERGRSFNSANEKDTARPLFIKAFELGREAGEEFHAVDAAHMMGIAGETPEIQLEWNVRAMEMAETAHEERAKNWLGPLYNNIGWTYHDMADYDQALTIFERSLAWRQNAGHEAETRIAKWCVGRCLRSLKRVQEALDMQLVLLEDIRKAGAKSDGYVHEEIGECLMSLDRGDEAPPYFAEAYELLSQDQWLVKNEPDRLMRLKELSQIK